MTDLDKGKSASPATFVDVTKPKKTRKRTRKNPGTPGHAAAEGYSDAMASEQPRGETHRITPICAHLHEATADMSKSAADMAAMTSRDGGGSDASGDSFNNRRVSPGLSREQGNQSVSSGDHGGSAGPGSNRQLAFGHRDLRQGSPDVMPFGRAGVTTGPTFVGQAAWSNGQFADSDAPPGADRGRPRLQTMDLAVQSGSVTGTQSLAVDYDSRYRPTDFASARGSGTPQNGTHSLGSPESNAVSNKDAREIMRKAMFGR